MFELESGENRLWWFNTGKKNLFRRLLIPAPDETTAQAWADEICGKGHRVVTERIRSEVEYFSRNAQRMRYPRFRKQHLFVGSGVMAR